ncbi:DUF4430 domain-containing protein (plasmid) [Bacillus mycoides]|uniref:Transcobalamin-like C-terminal domain-containing protein n=1 Tax=Bacillus mycoides TaxID=1405 RepID=A0ABC9QUU7_BACMY|nr:DUF4430 domain-containing protein [Bacillus mycoides]EJR29904.1 hypothetical protein III_05673 [Bacillus mycoides]QWG70542.1 DUF4430 domain-containing protein [Bacillus mycoides]
MRKSKCLIVFLLMFMFVFSGCQGKKEEAKKTDVITYQVTIEVTTENGKSQVAKEKVKVEDGKNLYDVMKENFKIEDDKGMITSINNKKQNKSENKYWMFDINKEPAMKGIKDIQLKDGDVITWDLHETK